MAFWGVEVKAGKTYTHLYDRARGRLHISQAALGNGKSMNKCVVQCNIGDKVPIVLCNLNPNILENVYLNLEFEEPDEVIFSALGGRNVYLSGYYIASGHKLDGDSDSYGEDIGNTDSGSWERFDDEDEYESDFIDDNSIETSSPSPRRKSGVVTEKIVKADKPSNGNTRHRRLIKKHQVGGSEDEDDADQKQHAVQRDNNTVILDSSDDDAYPISSFFGRTEMVKDSQGNLSLKSDNNEVNEKQIDAKIDAISTSFLASKYTCQPIDPSLPLENGQESKVRSKEKKKKKEKGKVEEKALEAEDGGKMELNEADDELKIGGADEKTKNDGSPNKKKKRAKNEKKPEASSDASVKIKDMNEASNHTKVDQDPPLKIEKEKLPYQREDRVVSAATQETIVKLKKKHKKRTKDERGSDAEVSDATKKKKKKESKKSRGVDPTQTQ